MSLIKIFKANIYYTIFALAIGAALLGLLFLHSGPTAPVPLTGTVLHAGSLSIPVTIADTEATREQGLSDTASLPANAGMLFRFDTPDRYGFWMKDMRYDLDMVWMDENLKVVDISRNVAAASYPEVVTPSSPVLYVLEVNAGFSTAHAIQIGQQLTLTRS